MSLLKVLGMDPSMNNWGLALGTYDLVTEELLFTDIQTLCPFVATTKSTRTNSKDIERSRQLYSMVLAKSLSVDLVFAEVPVGSQGARSSVGYGICCAVLGSLAANGHTSIQVAAEEVKVIMAGRPKATKKQVTASAFRQYPDLPWPMHKRKGEMILTANTAEHMADAIGTLKAGLETHDFRSMLPILKRQMTNKEYQV